MFVIYCYKYLELSRGSMVMAFSAQCLACDPFHRRNRDLLLLAALVVVVWQKLSQTSYTRKSFTPLYTCRARILNERSRPFHAELYPIKWKCPTVLLQSTDFIMTTRLALIKQINFVHRKKGLFDISFAHTISLCRSTSQRMCIHVSLSLCVFRSQNYYYSATEKKITLCNLTRLTGRANGISVV